MPSTLRLPSVGSQTLSLKISCEGRYDCPLLVLSIVSIWLGTELGTSRPHLLEPLVPLEPVPELALDGRLPREVGFRSVWDSWIQMPQLPLLVRLIKQVLFPVLLDDANSFVPVTADGATLALFNVDSILFKGEGETGLALHAALLQSEPLVKGLDAVCRLQADFLEEFGCLCARHMALAAVVWMGEKSQGLAPEALNARELQAILCKESHQVRWISFQLLRVAADIYRCRHSGRGVLEGDLCCWCVWSSSFITFKNCPTLPPNPNNPL